MIRMTLLYVRLNNMILPIRGTSSSICGIIGNTYLVQKCCSGTRPRFTEMHDGCPNQRRAGGLYVWTGV